MRCILFTCALLLLAAASGCTCYHAPETNYGASRADRPDCRQNAISISNTYGIARENSCCSDFPVTFRNYENCENRYQRYEWISQPRMAIPCAANVVIPQK
jgi:hypothetical protein